MGRHLDFFPVFCHYIMQQSITVYMVSISLGFCLGEMSRNSLLLVYFNAFDINST